MTAKVILNPYANRWLALKRQPEVEDALKACGIQYELVVTDKPGHGTDLAIQAAQAGFTPIISAGGDGSISEVMNGMVLAAQQSGADPVPLGIMPLGSANDLVVNLGLPKDLPGAAQVIAAANTRMLDLGQVTYGTPPRSRFFDNNSAMGLEPSVTLVQQGITRLRGVLRYLVATVIAISRNPRWQVRLEWENGSYEGKTTLVTVGNNPITGGLFYMTPHANPYDGLLTFVYGYLPSRLKIFAVLPRTMRPGAGSYVEHPAIHEVHSPWLRIYAANPTPLHADGEIQSEAVQEIEYRVLPAYLPVLLP
jgi:diacylglycerol kinase (ATP)